MSVQNYEHYTVKPQALLKAGAKEITFDDLLNAEWNEIVVKNREVDLSGTITFITAKRHCENMTLWHLETELEQFVQDTAELRAKDRHSLYRSFNIPKRKGGYRTINAPTDELRIALDRLKGIMVKWAPGLYHTAAFAYIGAWNVYDTLDRKYVHIPGRCTKDFVLKHQRNGSNWELKTDFSDFFGSTNKEFAIKMLKKIEPYCYMEQKLLSDAFDLCFLDNGLPQGTTCSPLISNIIMIPIDHAIAKVCMAHKIVYTRYADDILMSTVERTGPKMLLDIIKEALDKFEAPYVIKPEKTKYVSKKGKNWVLGMMWNSENQITIGAENKKKIKAMLYNLLNGVDSSAASNYKSPRQVAGLISYYKMIEPKFVEKMLDDFQERYPRIDVRDFLKHC